MEPGRSQRVMDRPQGCPHHRAMACFIIFQHGGSTTLRANLPAGLAPAAASTACHAASGKLVTRHLNPFLCSAVALQGHLQEEKGEG